MRRGKVFYGLITEACVRIGELNLFQTSSSCESESNLIILASSKLWSASQPLTV